MKILVKDLLDYKKGSQQDLFDKHEIETKVILENYNIPHNKLWRILNAIILLTINLVDFGKIFKYYKSYDKFSLTYLYEFVFYKKFANVDNIHVQFGTGKHPVDKLKKASLLKGNLITSFHGHDLYFPINGRIPRKGYYNDLFNYGNVLVSNTPFLEKIILDLGAPSKKVLTIPVGVNTDIFKPIEKEFTGVIKLITVGRLEALKGQVYGLQCVKHLVEKGYKVEYSLVGDGREFLNLKKKIEEYNLQNHVGLLGSKNQQAVKCLLRDSHIFLMTSVIDPKDGMEESQGLVTAEAQASGLPVVAFDSGGIKYTILNGSSGFICSEKDMDCYVNKVERLIKDPHLLREMGENARNYIKANFSDTRVASYWDQIYNGVPPTEISKNSRE